ncbi:helix-turn-helix domain-containing protein [Microlunatus speluncae]|uniref:helix-turn-helix domain-containing protein n=1 Tax=Microlunatus speluncae TaxID=2594267 RepID=UPI0012663132|nr:AraC family transcriptional regulator [Microlunatus speluncae]
MSAIAVGMPEDRGDPERSPPRSHPPPGPVPRARPLTDRWAPVIATAHITRLSHAERLGFTRVASRMFLHVLAGTGRVEVNGQAFEVRPHDIVGMPWLHAVRYRPSRGDPLLISTVHLIPRHHLGHPIELAVPHEPDEPLADVPWRADGPLLIPDRPFLSDGRARPGLASLIDYLGRTWRRGRPPIGLALRLGSILVFELNSGEQHTEPHDDEALPPRLRRAMAWARGHLYRPITVADLCAAADVSPSTLRRQFRSHLDSSPLLWVQRIRLERSTELLTESLLGITQIARRLGFADSHYFARVFARRYGLPPSEWRRRRWQA